MFFGFIVVFVFVVYSADLHSEELTKLTYTEIANPNSKIYNTELQNNYVALNNNTNINTIKKLLSTKQGITFIKNLTFNKPIENQRLWRFAIHLNDIQLLRELKSIGIKMTLSNDELVDIIYSFESVDYYETIEYLTDYIKMDDNIAYELINKLTTPNSKNQQTSQFEIYKKLIEKSLVKHVLKEYFYLFVYSLNIQLVDFVIKELKLDINELFRGYSVLQLVVDYLIEYPNKNNEFAYDMFDHLISIGADINKRDKYDNNIYYYIHLISDKNIQNKLNELIDNHKKSKYKLIRSNPKKTKYMQKIK